MAALQPGEDIQIFLARVFNAPASARPHSTPLSSERPPHECVTIRKATGRKRARVDGTGMQGPRCRIAAASCVMRVIHVL